MPEENALVPLASIPNIAELAAYVPVPPPSAGEFLPYVHMHWPVQGPGKPYHLQLTDGGKANAIWMEWPFAISVIFAREAAKVPNLTNPEDTEWAFASMPHMTSASDARYRELVGGSVQGVEKGTSYVLALWKQGVDEPMIVSFDAFKTMNNATFHRLADARMNLRKGLHFNSGDLGSCMKQSSKTNRWFPDAGLFSNLSRLTDLTPGDADNVRLAMGKVESKLVRWLTR